jgi:quinol monooxygenase YgiN
MAFVRVGLFKAKAGSADDLCRTYSTQAIPVIRAAKGNVSALLLRPHEAENDFLAITVWSSRQDAELYDQGGQARQMVDTIRPMFAAPPRLMTYDAYGAEA